MTEIDPQSEEQQLLSYLGTVLIAWDTNHKFWNATEVERAQKQLTRVNYEIPTYENLCRRFGEDRVRTALNAILDDRTRELELSARLLAVGDPCHSCGETRSLMSYPYGLVRVKKTTRDWTTLGISAAVSAVALPLLGVGALHLAGKQTTGNLVKLNLVLCPSCSEQKRGIFAQPSPHFA